MYVSNVNAYAIKVQSITCKIDLADSHYPLHTEDCSHFLYLKAGKLGIDLDDQALHLRAGDLAIINPQTTYHLQAKDNIKYYLVKIEDIVLTSNISIHSEDQGFHIPSANLTGSYLDLALQEVENPQRGSDLIIRRLIECILIHVLRNPDYSIKEHSDQDLTQEIQKIQAFIRQHYADKVSLEDLAQLIQLNKFKLIRLFKQATGLSPIDYLIHVRIEEAKNLLLASSLSVADISESVGFHSPSHFSKAFKSLNHMTPSDYRKQAAEKHP